VRVVIPLDVGLSLLGDLPGEVAVSVWDPVGSAGAPPGGGAGVDLWVPPFPPLASYAERLAQLPDLRVLQLLTAGYDHVLTSVPDGLTVCNAGHIHDDPVAEWAVAGLLAMVRALPIHIRAQAAGESLQFESDTLIGATVLLLGYGGIGQAIARRLAGFQVEVVPVASRARPHDGVHGPGELPDLLPAADAVVIAAPVTAATRGMVDAAFLARLPDGAVIVNAARGAIVDQPALAAELTTGRLRAVLDVTTPDPLPAGDPLRAHLRARRRPDPPPAGR